MSNRLLSVVLLGLILPLCSCLDTKLDITAQDTAVTPDDVAQDQTPPADADTSDFQDLQVTEIPDDTVMDSACTGGACDVADAVSPCSPQNCKTSDPCLVAECDSQSGECDLNPTNEGGPCEDGNGCTLQDFCQSGQCQPGLMGKACDDNNACTDNTCNPVSGKCEYPNNTDFCDDGNPCTVLDKCAGGQCKSTTANECDDFNFCTNDTCTQALGCQHEPLTGAFCDDGNTCTLGETCMAGFCGGGSLNLMAPGCVPVCMNGKCEPGEVTEGSGYTCAHDCGYCGDDICSATEQTNGSCVKDCDVVCGDHVCDGGEGVTICLVDCNGCGDHFCGTGEIAGADDPCPGDCPASCGNGICEVTESANNCEYDCKPSCGDNKCEMAEAASTCPQDCGVCGDGLCALPDEGATCPLDCVRPCGDGKCEGGESPETCAVDCGPCGDFVCGKLETADTCPADCSLSCGDGLCTMPENETNCFADCGCKPDCLGKKCGPDGCGGQCGVCPPAVSCNGVGQCACIPNCAGKTCGEDGCGAVCGVCPGGYQCKGGGASCCSVGCTDAPCSEFCVGICGKCAGSAVCQANGTCL